MIITKRTVIVKSQSHLTNEQKQQMKKVRFVAISDTHNYHNKLQLPAGDVLIHCGDFSKWGLLHHIISFARFLNRQSHAHKIVVLGNHDWWASSLISLLLPRNVKLLRDEITEICGLKLYGARFKPIWTLSCSDKGAKDNFDDIPDGIDILITHQPPKGVGNLDIIYNGESRGNEALRQRVLQVKPHVHVFGHNHDAGGFYDKFQVKLRMEF
jgi:Icc-related predicted phosphoesterase